MGKWQDENDEKEIGQAQGRGDDIGVVKKNLGKVKKGVDRFGF